MKFPSIPLNHRGRETQETRRQALEMNRLWQRILPVLATRPPGWIAWALMGDPKNTHVYNVCGITI